jgi:hypothetical protein
MKIKIRRLVMASFLVSSLLVVAMEQQVGSDAFIDRRQDAERLLVRMADARSAEEVLAIAINSINRILKIHTGQALSEDLTCDIKGLLEDFIRVHNFGAEDLFSLLVYLQHCWRSLVLTASLDNLYFAITVCAWEVTKTARDEWPSARYFIRNLSLKSKTLLGGVDLGIESLLKLEKILLSCLNYSTSPFVLVDLFEEKVIPGSHERTAEQLLRTMATIPMQPGKPARMLRDPDIIPQKDPSPTLTLQPQVLTAGDLAVLEIVDQLPNSWGDATTLDINQNYFSSEQITKAIDAAQEILRLLENSNISKLLQAILLQDLAHRAKVLRSMVLPPEQGIKARRIEKKVIDIAAELGIQITSPSLTPSSPAVSPTPIPSSVPVPPTARRVPAYRPLLPPPVLKEQTKGLLPLAIPVQQQGIVN